MMKRFLIVAVLAGVAFIANSCGEGGGSQNADFQYNTNTVYTAASSGSSATCFDVVDGDKLAKVDASTEITITHSISGTKNVCVDTGSVELSHPYL